MKNINKIIFACMIMAIGNLNASRIIKKINTNQSTPSKLLIQNLQIIKPLQINDESVDTTGMTLLYTGGPTATIKDSNGNVVYTFTDVVASSGPTQPAGLQKIGSYLGEVKSTSTGSHKAQFFVLYGTLVPANS